jgi:SSS family solute:Na+ symporter
MVLSLGAALAAVTLFWGWLGARRTHTSPDYLIAGRSARPSVMGLSFGATLVSPAVIIGLGAQGGGWSPAAWGPVLIGLIVGLVVAFLVLGGRTATLGAVLSSQTFPQLVGQRLQSRGLRAFTGLIVFFISSVLAAAVLTGIARWLSLASGVPEVFVVLGIALVVGLNVTLGGLKAVMYNHVFQAALVVVIVVIAAAATWLILGQTEGAGPPPIHLTGWGPPGWPTRGWLAWLYGPHLGAGLIGGLGLGLAAQPQLAVRFLTVPTWRRVRGAFFWAALYLLIALGAAWALGVWSHQIVWAKGGGAVGGPEPALALALGQGTDFLVPFMDRFWPGWLKSLFGLGLLAAALAVLSSLVHLGGVSLGRDVLAETWRGHVRGGQAMVLLARFGAALSVIGAVLWARWLPDPVLSVTAWSSITLAVVVWLPAYGLGLYWRGLTRAGAWASMLVGLFAWLLHLLFVGADTAPVFGLCQSLLGRPTVLADLGPRVLGWSWWSGDLAVQLLPLAEPVSDWWRLQFVNPIALILPLSLVTAVAVSQVTRRPDQIFVDLCWRAFGSASKRGPGPA